MSYWKENPVKNIVVSVLVWMVAVSIGFGVKAAVINMRTEEPEPPRVPRSELRVQPVQSQTTEIDGSCIKGGYITPGIPCQD